MKRLYLLTLWMICSLFAFAQQSQNQIIWFNGKLLHTSTIEVEDSAILGTVWETATVQLVIPHALVQIQHDTVHIVDTVVKVIHDTINHYYTNIIRDTLVVNNYVEIDAATAKKYAGVHFFSVGPKNKILFSPGNLQYHPSKQLWRFAEHQYDIIGDSNKNTAPKYADWIDLFAWGTRVPTVTTTNANSYTDFVEWGTYPIGIDKPRTWRTLTQAEWVYLIEERPNANKLCGMAEVAGVNGLILLPDFWTTPPTVIFKSGLAEESGIKYFAKHQTISEDQWKLMEEAGAVFLPAAGYRYGTDVLFVEVIGRYWSSTPSVETSAAAAFVFYSIEMAPHNFDNKCRGLSVRLVKDI